MPPSPTDTLPTPTTHLRWSRILNLASEGAPQHLLVRALQQFGDVPPETVRTGVFTAVLTALTTDPDQGVALLQGVPPAWQENLEWRAMVTAWRLTNTRPTSAADHSNLQAHAMAPHLGPLPLALIPASPADRALARGQLRRRPITGAHTGDAFPLLALLVDGLPLPAPDQTGDLGFVMPLAARLQQSPTSEWLQELMEAVRQLGTLPAATRHRTLTICRNALVLVPAQARNILLTQLSTWALQGDALTETERVGLWALLPRTQQLEILEHPSGWHLIESLAERQPALLRSTLISAPHLTLALRQAIHTLATQHPESWEPVAALWDRRRPTPTLVPVRSRRRVGSA
jgi:hypothetical protein